MSRKIVRGRVWGRALKNLRERAGLTGSQIGAALGYSLGSDSKSNVSLIEHGQIPIKEEMVRKWVQACGKVSEITMFNFYEEAIKEENKEMIRSLPSLIKPSK